MGNVIKQTITCADGTVKTYDCTYDINGQPLSVTDVAGVTSSQMFDSSGNITELVYPEGGGISYTYDDMHRLTKETLSIGTEYSYEYNSDNLLSKYTNGRGQETTYEYDKLGRIISATDELGTISYTYDGCGNVLTVSETDNDGNTSTISRTYDCMNRISSYTDYKGNTVKYGYDELGNLISLTYAGGEIVRYKYYDNGALKEVIDTENLITSYTYDKRGNLLTTQNPDGTVEVNTYDELSRLVTKTLYKAAAGEEVYSEADELYSCSYTYDDSGNITEITYKDNLSDKTSDGLLSDVKNETDVLESSTMTYDSSNRMITYNGKTVEYDDDGNMTYGPLNGRMVKFTYDCRNRLIKAGDTEYTYDAENIRTNTKTPYYTEEYITDSAGALSRVLEVDRTYNEKQVGYNKDNSGKNFDHEVYYYGNGLLYQKSYSITVNSGGTAGSDNGTLLVYHYDHLGSTKLVTDSAGKSVCKFDYGTYGELLTTEYDKTIKFLYNGQLGVITDDNGLYYMRSRYYNPEIKRFINQDILTGDISNSASLNRYSYVEGNPVSYTDPFGLSPFRVVHDIFHACFYIPVIGHGFAAADSLLYLAEGEYTKAGISAVYAIPGFGTYAGLAIEASTGAASLFLPDEMVQNHDFAIIQDLFEYSHYDEMSRGQRGLTAILFCLGAVGEYRSYNTQPMYEGIPENVKAKTRGRTDADYVNETSYGKSSINYKNSLDYLKDIENINGKYYADKKIIDEIGQIEARGEEFSRLNKSIMSSRASTEGGTSIVYRYSDEYGTKYMIHEVTNADGYIIHRDFDAVRISSGQIINKGH